MEKIHEPFGLKGGIEPMVYPASHVSIKHLFWGELPTPNCLSKMFGIPNSPNFLSGMFGIALVSKKKHHYWCLEGSDLELGYLKPLCNRERFGATLRFPSTS